jgi:hypothetical protein
VCMVKGGLVARQLNAEKITASAAQKMRIRRSWTAVLHQPVRAAGEEYRCSPGPWNAKKRGSLKPALASCIVSHCAHGGVIQPAPLHRESLSQCAAKPAKKGLCLAVRYTIEVEN